MVCRRVVNLAQVRRRWSQRRIPRFRYPAKPIEQTGEVLLQALSVRMNQKKHVRKFSEATLSGQDNYMCFIICHIGKRDAWSLNPSMIQPLEIGFCLFLRAVQRRYQSRIFLSSPCLCDISARTETGTSIYICPLTLIQPRLLIYRRNPVS